MSSLSNQISNVFDSDSFVPADLQDRLDDFTATGVDNINISQFRSQINRGILSFNITEQIDQLEMFRQNISIFVSILNYKLYNNYVYLLLHFNKTLTVDLWILHDVTYHFITLILRIRVHPMTWLIRLIVL